MKYMSMMAVCLVARMLRVRLCVAPPGIATVFVCLLLPIVLSACQCHQASPILYWGSVPNEEGMRQLKSLGIKTIVNLRTNSHKGRSKFASEIGLGFHHIKTGVVLTPEEAELRKFLTILCNPANQPVYVCCNIGIDRTSYYVAAYRVAMEGWTVKQATDEMLAHGLKAWWPTFREYDDSLRANEAVLRRIARQMKCPDIVMQKSWGVCPCVRLGPLTGLSSPANSNLHREARAR
ncbi:MAG: dual specificity protein phosphatase family protein [Candidatus Melainabacteria bacterium]|nr:dual specificity protein phosphatase family protein [Candidatus Melainabacteria bacterium]